ncbi:MAG: hypothetical protein ACOX63_14545 [Christensenellales bacterium]|jgi:hypothetical protein
MSTFKIDIAIDKNFFNKKEKRELIYYSRKDNNYLDSVSFYRKHVSISGSRTHEINKIDLLETTNSTYYADIIKSLLYVYYEKGCFEVESIVVYVDDELLVSYRKNKIKQEFSYESLIDINSQKLFADKKISDIVMNSLMNLTLASSNKDLQFDYSWKCFNTLISKIFDERTEQNKLKKLRRDLEADYSKYPNISSFIPVMDVNYMNSCHINDMINNNYPKGSTGNLVSFFKSFKDYRVSEVLKDKMKCKKDDLNDIGKYDEIDSYYNNNIQNKVEKETDIIRLVILKYAYYLRCKYFHGEKIPSNFLISNMNQIELDRISIPLRIICKDLLENIL